MRFVSAIGPFGAAALGLGMVVTAVLPAKGSELSGVYEVHRICTVRPADKKTTGTKDKLFAKIQEGDILVRDDPRLIDPEKRLFAQILDQKGGRFLYEGLLDIELAATPDNRAFNEFDGSLVACSAVRKHQPLDYLELIELKGVTGGNLVSWAVPSWVLGPVPKEERNCKYIFAETKEPAIRAKFPKDVPPCLERPTIPTPGVAAGDSHTCALLADGSAQCWGANGSGQLGDNNAPNDSPVPVDVVQLGGKVIGTTGGGLHTCAVLADGSAQCWGENLSGQLGDNNAPNDGPVPVDVVQLGGKVIGTTGGGDHTCAVLADGSAQCWGLNNAGQLGNDSTGFISPVPVDVVQLGGKVIGIAAGGGHTCAVFADGSAQCWGLNNAGQLGDNNAPNNNPVPVDVVQLGGKVIGISTGNNHTCAVLADGSAQCWGLNNAGQLGNDSTGFNSPVPVDVVQLGGKVIALAGGGFHTCAVLADGSVQCWGSNFDGQLGDGTNTDSAVPVDVVGLPIELP